MCLTVRVWEVLQFTPSQNIPDPQRWGYEVVAGEGEVVVESRLGLGQRCWLRP